MEYQRKLSNIIGYHKYHGMTWDIIEYQWNIIEYHGISRNIMEYHCIYWHHGIPMEYHVISSTIQWNIMEYQWNIIERNGISCNTIEYQEYRRTSDKG